MAITKPESYVPMYIDTAIIGWDIYTLGAI